MGLDPVNTSQEWSVHTAGKDLDPVNTSQEWSVHTAGMGLDPVNTSQEWSVHRAGMGLAGDIANHGIPSATLSAAERRVLEALQLQRELESTIQLLISTKVLTRPKTAAGGGTVAADQLQLQQASAIKLLEC